MTRSRARQKKALSNKASGGAEMDPVEIDPRYVAARELLGRARSRVTAEDVRQYAPNDPGYPTYVSAFEAILREGEPALTRDFAVTETIALTRWTLAENEKDPLRFRWFRILTCAVEILIESPYPDTPHYGLAALLVDSFALAESGDKDAPLDLLAKICLEIRPSYQRMGEEERVYCLIARLVLADVDRLDPSEIEALCASIEETYSRFERYWEDEAFSWHDEPNPEKFLWGLTHFDMLHSVWLDLIKRRFPRDPPTAERLRERLLLSGKTWSQHERRLN